MGTNRPTLNNQESRTFRLRYAHLTAETNYKYKTDLLRELESHIVVYKLGFEISVEVGLRLKRQKLCLRWRVIACWFLKHASLNETYMSHGGTTLPRCFLTQTLAKNMVSWTLIQLLATASLCLARASRLDRHVRVLRDRPFCPPMGGDSFAFAKPPEIFGYFSVWAFVVYKRHESLHESTRLTSDIPRPIT